MSRSLALAVLCCAALALLACNDDGGGSDTPATPTPAAATDTLPATPTAEAVPTSEPAVAKVLAAVRAELATRISADDAAAAAVFSVEPKDWPDACLGLARPDEVCAQVITLGYEIILVDRGNTTYVYRTSTAGNVRLEEAVPEF